MIYFTKFKSIYGNEIVLIYQINDELIVPSSSYSVQFQNYCRYIPKYWSPNHSKSKSSQVTFEKLIWMEEVDQNEVEAEEEGLVHEEVLVKELVKEEMMDMEDGVQCNDMEEKSDPLKLEEGAHYGDLKGQSDPLQE